MQLDKYDGQVSTYCAAIRLELYNTNLAQCWLLTFWMENYPYLTFEVDATRGSIQRSGHWVGPLRVLIKPKAMRISQKL